MANRKRAMVKTAIVDLKALAMVKDKEGGHLELPPHPSSVRRNK